MAVVADRAYVIGGLGLPTIGPGYGIQSSQLGEHVVQDASVVDPRSGWPSTSLPSSLGLGLITESDAWLTGRTSGLPGTATVHYANGQASMLGAVEVAPGYRVPPGALGIAVNEIQRSVNFGDAPSPSLFDKPGAIAMLATIGGTILAGILGAVATRER